MLCCWRVRESQGSEERVRGERGEEKWFAWLTCERVGSRRGGHEARSLDTIDSVMLKKIIKTKKTDALSDLVK